MTPDIAPAATRPEGSIYRAVWRWHFYAGLMVLPFLLWLAITGGLYLYKPEIERLVYRDWSELTPRAAILPLDRLVPAIERQSGARVTQIARPAGATASWRMTIVEPGGARRLAFVDPYAGRLIGVTSDGGLMQTIRTLHSLSITGPIGNALIEIVAGWAILLVLSGLYLWWPRRGSPIIGLRGRPRSRIFWRDLHASVGLGAAGVILFLALTGMPWTGVWGGALQGYIAGHGLGRPPSPGAGHDHGAAARAALPWSMQASAPPVAHRTHAVGPARIARIAAAHGLDSAWTMTLPAAAGAPYVLSAAITRAQDAHVLYIDGATGRVMQDSRYAGFGPGARLIEWGIATHQGQQYGEANRLLMLAGCLSIALLALTAPILWWKRRRDGRLAAPPRPRDRRKARGVAAMMIAVGAIFPLTGASLLVILAIDRLIGRSAKAR